MARINNQRLTADVEGEFVVFLIGMRINKPWKLHKWLPVALAMPRMLAELRKHPESGFLGAQQYIGVIVQYWRSFEHLEAYARARDSKHYPAWTRFNKSVGSNGDVGIWHETYRVPAGSYETVYNQHARLRPRQGNQSSCQRRAIARLAAGRIGAVAHAQADAAVEASRGM